jgi:carbonic anhydrase/acetyltransferase-like protein (isoleucine patch superfamily)
MLIRLEADRPEIDPTAFIAATAVLTGRVRIGPGSNVWFGTVIRGDVADIIAGADTNIQDLTMVHADEGLPTTIGDRVTVGHRAIIHGCTLEDECLVGMGAVIQNGARIGTHAIVASGSVVREGFVLSPGMLAVGVPARVKRPVTPQEIELIRAITRTYSERARRYRETARVSRNRPDA